MQSVILAQPIVPVLIILCILQVVGEGCKVSRRARRSRSAQADRSGSNSFPWLIPMIFHPCSNWDRRRGERSTVLSKAIHRAFGWILPVTGLAKSEPVSHGGHSRSYVIRGAITMGAHLDIGRGALAAVAPQPWLVR